MTGPALLLVTGASGTGKTTLVRGLEQRGLPRIHCHYFDSIGVPTPDEMIRQYGGGEQWQHAMTGHWIRRLAIQSPPGSVAVLDGQVRPSVALEALAVTPFPVYEILLIDCSHAVRESRLRTTRGQPELASVDMAAWAAYLRGQSDALRLPRLDTTSSTVDDSLEQLIQRANQLLARSAG